MRTPAFVAPARLVLLLAVCPAAAGPGGESPGVVRTVTAQTGGAPAPAKVGMVSLLETRMGNVSLVIASGSFHGGATPTAAPSPGNPPAGVPDGCQVGREVDGGLPALNPDPGSAPQPGPAPTSLDAGPQLTVKSGAATYATLKKREAQGSISYSSDLDPLNPLPAIPGSGLTLDIPGVASGFPAFEGVAFPAAGPFALTAPTDKNGVTLDTSFAWSGASAGGSLVVLVGSGPDSANPGKEVGFACYAADDGTFAFPQAAKTELAAKGYTTGGLEGAGRLVSRTETKGDAQLSVTVIRLESFR